MLNEDGVISNVDVEQGRALRAELNKVGQHLDPLQEEILFQLRALRADLSRVGPKDLGKVAPLPKAPESTRRLDTLFLTR